MAEPIHQIPVIHDEHDPNASAKRVVSAAPLGRSVSYEDTSFVSGDSPAVLAVNTDLGRNGRNGYIANDGAGNFTVEISDDGTNYGGVHTLQDGEALLIKGISINKIRITWVADSSYRCFII